MRDAKTDRNQPEIVKALEDAGCSVQLLHRVGGGCPDLLVGRINKNFLLEVKDGDRVPSERKLNERQEKWHREWKGQKIVVTNAREALDAVGLKG